MDRPLRLPGRPGPGRKVGRVRPTRDANGKGRKTNATALAGHGARSLTVGVGVEQAETPKH